jgi:arginyl-tRNA synthetase
MKPICDILEQRVTEAMASLAGDISTPAVIKTAQNPKFGDYQANGVMGLAKKLKQKPRELAVRIVEKLDVSDMCEPPEIAGPGFINFRLRPAWLADRLTEALKDQARLGIDPLENPPVTVVDFSSPNIAKQMHVGHLRSTIIGDVIARILEFWYGDENRWDFKPDPENLENYIHNPEKRVLRQNHIGDWGTQFGMVILGLWHLCMAEKHEKSGKPNYIEDELTAIKKDGPQGTYSEEPLRQIRDRHENDWREDSLHEEGDGEKVFKPFLENIKNEDITWDKLLKAYQFVNLIEELVRGKGLTIPTRPEVIAYELLTRKVTGWLQIGDEQEILAWQYAREISLDHCQGIYDLLGVKLTKKDVRGESCYRDDLPSVIFELSVANLLQKSAGAQCVFLEGFKTKEGEPLPLIVQKSDGAYLYATTDLAAIRYRVGELKSERIIYVTDARQKLHFEMFFACARKAGWAPEKIKLEHVPFGSVLGDDGRPFKTRSGENVKLQDLLEEAEVRARRIVEDKNPDLPEKKKKQIARAVGIGAVKYADLSNNLVSDYVFNWDKMLAMDGNTAPYMQYAYARVQSIFNKGKIDKDQLLEQDHLLELKEPEELALAKLLLRYGETVEAVARDLRPHLLTSYLFELAQSFSVFYTNCPVLKMKGKTRISRLLLCHQTAATIRHGMDLLGIETIEQM